MVAGYHSQAEDGILVHPNQAARLTDAAIFLEVM